MFLENNMVTGQTYSEYIDGLTSIKRVCDCCKNNFPEEEIQTIPDFYLNVCPFCLQTMTIGQAAEITQGTEAFPDFINSVLQLQKN